MNKHNKQNVFLYLAWRGDLSFIQDSFNEIDGYIFSQLSFFDMTNIVTEKPIQLKDALKMYFKKNPKDSIKLGLIVPNTIVELGEAVMNTNRFGNVLISNYCDKYDESKKEQFCAVTFHLPHNQIVISYKGTDDTLIGWEENFNMVIKYPVEAQTSSLDYFNKIFEMFSKNSKYTLLGHSKGGNLAMYAGIYSDSSIKESITKIINYDGPGFEDGKLDLSLYEEVKTKIFTIIPEHSSIGMIFNRIGNVSAIKSTFRGLYQHDGFSWTTLGTNFVSTTLSKDSINFSNALNAFVASLKEDERRAFCKSIENYIKESGSRTLLELNSDKVKSLQSLKVFNNKERLLLFKLFRIMLKYHMI